MLNWKTKTPSTSGQFLVKGAVLSTAKFGPHGRFLVEEARAYDADGNADREYRVRDASTVSDADIRAGKPSQIVSRTSDYDELLAFVARHSEGGSPS